MLPKFQGGGFRYQNPSIILPGGGGGCDPPKPPCSGAHTIYYSIFAYYGLCNNYKC